MPAEDQRSKGSRDHEHQMPDDDEIGDGDDCEMVDGDDGEEILKDLESEQGSSESDDSTELQKLVDAARALSCSGSEPEADEPNPPPADGDESPTAELPKRNKRPVPQACHFHRMVFGHRDFDSKPGLTLLTGRCGSFAVPRGWAGGRGYRPSAASGFG